jgi:hypothetical protein
MTHENDDKVAPGCWCRACIGERIAHSERVRLLDPGELDGLTEAIENLSRMRLVHCQICGKRSCPHADHHDNICTWPNEDDAE